MEKTKQRPGVMVYFHLTEPLRCLPREDFADLMWAVLDYAQYGVLPQFENPMLQMSWGYLQHAADVDKERYELRCQNAKAAIQKRWSKQEDTNVYDRIPKIPYTNTQADTDTHTDTNADADADADTQASASASTQTETTADTDPNTGEDLQRAEVGPAAGEEPLATPPKMTNSVSWAKMQAASVGRRRGEELERWRQEQLAEITRQNEAIRAEARAKKAAQGLARTPK